MIFELFLIKNIGKERRFEEKKDHPEQKTSGAKTCVGTVEVLQGTGYQDS